MTAPEDAATAGLPDGREDTDVDAVALWPVVCLAFFGIMAAMVTAMRFPLGPVSLFIVLALVVPVAVGLRRAAWARRRWRSALAVLLPAALAVWLVGWDFTGHALPDTPSFSPDAWAYNAIADYFEHFPRGQDAGMNTLDQYGSVHQENRLLSASLLAVLRHTLGNVSAANYLFLVFCLSGHFLSLFFFARAVLETRIQALAAAFLGTAAGWVCDAVMLGNYDNLLFVAFSPAVLGLAVRFSRWREDGHSSMVPGFRWKVLPPALLMAAIFYGYPEGAALTAVIACPLAFVLFGSCLSARDDRWKPALILAAVCGLTALLIIPGVPVFIGFLRRQMAASLDSQAARPGEGLLPGLLQTRFLSSLFALGDESPHASYGWGELLLSAALLGLTLIGAAYIGRRHRWFPWTGFVLLILCGWIGTIKHYDYGLYKIMFCGCWWIYPSIVAGWWRLTAVGRAAFTWPLRIALALALLGGMGWVRIKDRVLRVLPPGSYTMNTLLDLRAVPKLVGDAPLVLDLDNQLDELWAMFYLRQLHLLPVGASDYLEAAKPSLARGRDGSLQVADCRYILVSGVHRKAIWHDARCSLVAVEGALITRIENPPNNEDRIGDEHVFWMGTQPLILVVHAVADGPYQLRATRFVPGPSLPESTARSIQINDAGTPRTVTVDTQTTSLPLQLHRGENRVELRCLDKPTTRGLPSGDTRELLLALYDPAITEAGTP